MRDKVAALEKQLAVADELKVWEGGCEKVQAMQPGDKV